MADAASKPAVLFVEDAPDLREELREGLAGEGFTMLEAPTGEEAMRIAREKHPQVILLDLILPNRDGFELLETFSNDEELQSIPIIVLTNLSGAEHVERALALGAKAYLVKSEYSLPDIIERVRLHIAQEE